MQNLNKYIFFIFTLGLISTLQIHNQITNQLRKHECQQHSREITRYLGNSKLGKQIVFQEPDFDLVGIKGRALSIINSLGFGFRNPNTGQVKWTHRYGGLTGKQFQWIAEPGQKISKIKVWAGDYIQGIQVQTNKGKSSPHYGNRFKDMKSLNIGNSRAQGVIIRSQLFVNAIALILE